MKQQATSLFNDLVGRINKLRQKKQLISARAKNLILLGALALLCLGIYLSVADNTDIFKKVSWSGIWAILLVGVPLTVLLNVLEFLLSAKMISVKISFLKAVEVTIIGSAANMLPLPGSTMVRIGALKLSGAGYKKSTIITLLVALAWIGMAFLYAGVMLAAISISILGYAMAIMGLLTLFFSGLLVKQTESRVKDYLRLLVLKLAMVLIDALRIFWCFSAFNIDINFSQASAFVISGVLGSAVSIVPAGLGVREIVSAGLAPFVGIAASAAFLAATLNRVLGLCALVPVAGLLVLMEKKKKK